MKKLFFLTLFAGGLFACGEANGTDGSDVNQADVPGAVVAAFNAAYPNATDVEWEQEGGQYEVEFEIDGDEKEVTYGMDGTVISVDD